jgi:hypothetical protein
MLRDLLTQLILDAPEHVDSENIKFNIGHRSSVYQLYENHDKKIIEKNCLNKNSKILTKKLQNARAQYCPKIEFLDF